MCLKKVVKRLSVPVQDAIMKPLNELQGLMAVMGETVARVIHLSQLYGC